MREYQKLLGQSANIISWKLGGKIELLTKNDKYEKAQNELRRLKNGR